MSNSSAFFIVSVLILATIVIVFAMKYLTAVRRAKVDERYQNETGAAIENLRQEIDKLTKRITAVERLLKEVE